MKWTFKGVKPAFNSNGDEITVTEYEFYMDSRGGDSSTTTEYYKGDITPRGVTKDRPFPYQMYPPKGTKLKLGKDFTLENPKQESPKMSFGDPLKDKKWLVYGLIAVAGYFAYKKFIK